MDDLGRMIRCEALRFERPSDRSCSNWFIPELSPLVLQDREWVGPM